MSYNWNKFTHLFNEEGPTDAEIAAANKDVHTKKDPEYSPGSHLEKYKEAANRRARLPKPKKAGTPEEIKKAIAQHRADIYAAGEKSKGKLDDWTTYQTIGHIIAEVFGHVSEQCVKCDDDGRAAGRKAAMEAGGGEKGRRAGQKKALEVRREAQKRRHGGRVKKPNNLDTTVPRGGQFG